MPNATSGNIKKIKLSNGSIYSIFDQGALRLEPNTNKIITGVGAVDRAILDGHLSITEIDDVPLANVQYDVLVQMANGEIKKQDLRQVLKNLGLITAKVEGSVLDLAVIDFEGSI